MGLERFHQAQAALFVGFEAALAEIRTTGKRGHWIWYIFPQLRGLGVSAAARRYAIADVDEAIGFLLDPVLGPCLVTISEVVAERLRGGVLLNDLMRSEIDVLKLVSCLTLFEGVSEKNQGGVAERMRSVTAEILKIAGEQGIARCQWTSHQLHAGPPH